jgi:hypothetical protein
VNETEFMKGEYCYSKDLDVDTFFLRMDIENLNRLGPFLNLRPFFRTIDHLIADKGTLQLCTEPLIISIPLQRGKQKLLVNALSRQNVVVQPHENPQILSKRYLTLRMAQLIAALRECSIETVFVSGYGLKIPDEEFSTIFPKESVIAWDSEFRQSFYENLPEPYKGFFPPGMITEHGSNFFQVGRKFVNMAKEITLILPVGPHQTDLRREPFHLLGALGEKTDNNGVRHRFGSATFTSYPRYDCPDKDMVITKRIFYAVCYWQIFVLNITPC